MSNIINVGFDTIEEAVGHVEQNYSTNGKPCLELANPGEADEHWKVWTCRPDFSAGYPPDFIIVPEEDDPAYKLIHVVDSSHPNAWRYK